MPRIAKTEIDRIKSEVSLLDWVRGQGYELKKQGKDFSLSCPFHDDDTPSMIITPSKNLYHCFGCEAAGSVIDWVMKTQSVSFPHAMELLKSGNPSALAASHSSKDKTKVARSQLTHLEPLCPSDADGQTALQEVVGFYHQNLLNNTEAMAYLEKRGLMHPDLLKTFTLGLSNKTLSYRLPPHYQQGGKAIRDTLRNLGVLRKTGFEHFAGCLVIPVIDERGQVQEVYGRRTNANNKVDKNSRHLYLPGPHRGVWNASAFNAATGRSQHPASHGTSTSLCVELILCESLIDAMTFWVHGFQNVTASYGTGGFTDDHLEALKAYGIEKLLIAYDNDDAGNKAALSLAEKLTQAIPGIACYRVQFPQGMDANEYAIKVQPAQKSLDRLLRQARPMGKVAELEQQATVVDTAHLSVDIEKVPTDNIPAEISEAEIKLHLGNRFYRVRGFDKNLSYGQLKINLLAKSGELFHVDTLDLYQSRQRASFIQQAATELGCDALKLKKDLGLVLLKLEAIQDETIKKTLETKDEAPSLSDQDQKAALALLKNKNLIEQIKTDFNRLGVVGENTNVLTGYLASVSRKLDKPLAVMIQSSSAAGKSALMEAVLSLMPEEERVQYSAMTGQSLFYMGETNLKHKILAIAEEEGASNASYALKLLQSEGEITIASTGKDDNSGQLVTREYRVEGPVMLFLTTTAIDIDEELLNRCLVLTVNESREQTQRIHEQQRQRQTLEGLLQEADKSHITNLHQNAQRLLRSVLVVNPYAEQLTFLDTQTRTRRDHMKYLTLINSIALLHQYQREIKKIERNGNTLEYIEVTPQDIELANQLAHEVLGRTLDELPPQTRKLLKLICKWTQKQCSEETISQRDFRFSRRDIREVTGWSDGQLKIHCRRMEELEYLLVHRGGRGQSIVYELLFNGGSDDTNQLMGLIELEKLHNGGEKSGKNEQKTAPSQGQVRPKSGGSQGSKNTSQPNDTKDIEALTKSSSKHALYNEIEKTPPLLSEAH